VLGDAITVALMRMAAFSRSDFGRYHPGGKLGDATRRLGDLMVPASAMAALPAGATLAEASSLAAEGRTIRAGSSGLDESALVALVAASGGLGGVVEELLAEAPRGTAAMLAADAKALPGSARLGVSVMDNGRLLGYVSARFFR
jgi:arabinose-5-phosphate isomerase